MMLIVPSVEYAIFHEKVLLFRLYYCLYKPAMMRCADEALGWPDTAADDLDRAVATSSAELGVSCLFHAG